MKYFKYASFIIGALLFFSGCSCNHKEDNLLYQNDFYGSVMREQNIISDVSEILNDVKNKNQEIVNDDSASDFWLSSDYAYLSTELIDESYLEPIYLLGEYDEWSNVESAVIGCYSDMIDEGNIADLQVKRNGANDYSVSYTSYNDSFEWLTDENTSIHEIDITYDATHDWAQVCEYVTVSGNKILLHFYEYGRCKNTYIIQSDKERLVVNYKNIYDEEENIVNNKDGSSTTKTTAVLVGKKISSFYFTQLNGKNFKRNVFSYDSKNDELVSQYGFVSGAVTRDFELANAYGLTDTIFTHIDDISKEFVAEKGSFGRQLVYKNSGLNARIYNDLANQIEVFDFDKNGKCEHTFEDAKDTQIKVYYDEYVLFDENGEEYLNCVYYLSSGEELNYLGEGDNLIIEYDGKYYNVVDRGYNTDHSLQYVIIDTDDVASKSLVESLKSKNSGLGVYIESEDTDDGIGD